MEIFTVGHSNRSLDDFLDLLRLHQIEALADVRSYPVSRRHPHFSQQQLKPALAGWEIVYRHFRELGGLRQGQNPDSPNDGWESQGFRNYADHMASRDFAEGLDELIVEASRRRAVVMCAEADPLRCHRRMIADALTALRGVRVMHILGSDRCERHRLTAFAHVEKGALTYPAAQRRLF